MPTPAFAPVGSIGFKAAGEEEKGYRLILLIDAPVILLSKSSLNDQGFAPALIMRFLIDKLSLRKKAIF